MLPVCVHCSILHLTVAGNQMHRGSSTIKAVVRSVSGAQALVEVEGGWCGRCHEEGGCGGQQLTQMFCGPKSWQVANPIEAQIGDRVLICIEQGALKQTANLMYVLPLICLLFGALLGHYFFGELLAIVGAVLGGLLAFYWVSRKTNSASTEKLISRPYIVSRLS